MYTIKFNMKNSVEPEKFINPQQICKPKLRVVTMNEISKMTWEYKTRI